MSEIKCKFNVMKEDYRCEVTYQGILLAWSVKTVQGEIVPVGICEIENCGEVLVVNAENIVIIR